MLDLNENIISSVVPSLKETLGDDVRVERAALLKDGLRTWAVRAELERPGQPIQPVIIKQIKPVAESERGYTDWASLEFLARIPSAKTLAPGFVTGDPQRAIYCISDLGPHQTLEDLLREGSFDLVKTACVSLAEQTARLHVAGIGHEKEFLAIRAKLPSPECVDRKRDAIAWRLGLSEVRHWMAGAGETITNEIEAELDEVVRSYSDPGQFLAFTHGDPSPTNNHISGGLTRILDFEFAGYRNALFDLTAWAVLNPLPRALLDPMREAYRKELSVGFPVAANEKEFNEAWVAMLAYRALAILSWIPISVIDVNRPWSDGWTSRHAILAALKRLSADAAQSERFEAIAGLAFRASAKLQARWLEINEPVPPWPAFKS